MKRLPRCAAFHDLSSFGRSSLTIIIPALSSMGIQVCPVPTAVLSTHSGGFTDYSFIDLTDSMRETFAHWKKLGLTFEAIYPGFLGSPEQAGVVAKMIDDFRTPETLVVVDPVMGDGGTFYSSISPKMAEAMRDLVHRADVLTPNITEMFLLLDRPYRENCPREELDAMILELSEWGPRDIVVTSFPGKTKDTVDCRIYRNGEFLTVSRPRVSAHYPGTGDLFTSVLLGCLLQRRSLLEATERAARFICDVLEFSEKSGEPHREGVLFEALLNRLPSAPEKEPEARLPHFDIC